MISREQYMARCDQVDKLIRQLSDDKYLIFTGRDWKTGIRQFRWTAKIQHCLNGSMFTMYNNMRLPDDPEGNVWKWTDMTYSQLERRLENLKILVGYDVGNLDYVEVDDIVL